MKERIKKLREKIQVQNYTLCIEKLRLMTASLRQTEGKPPIIRRAKALANVLENISIFIEDGELIVGNTASKPMGLEIEYEYGIFNQDEIAALKEEGYIISEEDEKELIELNQYCQSRTLVKRMGDLFHADEKLWPFVQSGVVLPPWKNKEEGGGGGYAQGGMGLGPGLFLIGVDFAKVLNHGLKAIIEDAEEELKNLRFTSADSVKKEDFLKAVIISHKAIINFAHRFAELAREMAAKEDNPDRKKELERIAETCSWVPAHGARTFYEAMQSFWFTFLMITPSTTASLGRFDQYMYPFYKRDIEAKIVTDDEVGELLQCLRIKDMQLNRAAGKRNRQRHSGMAKWHNCTIGGLTPDGKDATNELTYLILDAAKECPTPHYTVTVRVHENTPEALLIKALEVVKTGIGLPAFVADKSYIAYLESQGVPIELARDYILTGCLDANLVGHSRVISFPFFVVPLVFDIFMHNGVDPKTGLKVGIETGDIKAFETFTEFFNGFKQQLRYFLELTAERNNVELSVAREVYADPVRSSLMADAIKEGKDFLERTMPFENGAVINAVGMINVADSLAAIKKLVFEDQKITMEQLQKALTANWVGYDDVRRMCLSVPKYGNDDDFVDNIAKELYQYFADSVYALDTILGGKHQPTAISITSHWAGGELTGATPDGRYAGEVLADGTMSPMQGRDTNGPTALMRSALKINQVPYEATLLNMKFHPTSLKTEAELKKLSDLIRTYLEFGGKHVQFNVVDKEVLRTAQKHPEQHGDLIVRVAGYSAYFVQIGEAVQEEIIARTEYTLPI